MKYNQLIRLFIFILFEAIFCNQISAQSIDYKNEFYLKWKNEKLSDSTRLEALNDFIIRHLVTIDLDSAYSYNKLAEKSAVKKNQDKQLGDSYNTYGIIYLNLSIYDSANYFFQRALSIHKKLKNISGIAASYNNLGITAINTEDYLNSIKYFSLGKKLKEELKDSASVASLLINISEVYRKIGQFDEAIKYLNEAELYNTNVNSKLHVRIANAIYGNLGVLYSNHIIDIPSARKYFALELPYILKLNNELIYTKYINNIGLCFAKEGKLDSALYYYDKAIQLANKKNDLYGLPIYMINKTDALFQSKKYMQAISIGQESLQLSDSLNLLDLKAKSHYELSMCYKRLGQYEKAFYHYEIYDRINDSISNPIKISKVISELTTQQQQQEILELQNQNLKKDIELQSKQNFIIILFFAALLIIVTSYIIIIRRKLLALRKEKELRSLNLGLQLNPHFIFNSINSIQEYILSEQNDQAHHFLSEFSKLIRLFLSNNRSQYIPISKEIDFLKAYISLEEQRLKSKIEFAIDIDDRIDSDEVLIPAMLLQPIVENSIWHGIRYSENKKISISITLNNKLITIQVIDNGVGINSIMSEKSIGLNIIKERVKYCYAKEPEFIFFKICNNPKGGTTVEIIIPIILSTV
jgi:tetratricopeptide (TPR) repeat protein